MSLLAQGSDRQPHLSALVAASLVLLVACAPGQTPTQSGQATSPAAPSTAPAPSTAGANDYDSPGWRQLIEPARREGKLVVAANPNPELRERIPRLFKDRFGVDIEFVIGRSNELLTRLQSERA